MLSEKFLLGLVLFSLPFFDVSSRICFIIPLSRLIDKVNELFTICTSPLRPLARLSSTLARGICHVERPSSEMDMIYCAHIPASDPPFP